MEKKDFIESKINYAQKCEKLKEYFNKCLDTFSDKKVEHCSGFYNALKSCDIIVKYTN